jgi:hypothetical protein
MGESVKKIFFTTLSLLCIIAFGKPVKTPESEEAAQIWTMVFQNKPIVSFEDSRALVNMFLLSPIGKVNVPARDMGLANIIISRFGTYAVRDTVSEKVLLERAHELKGGELSGEELEKIQNLAEKQERAFMRKHPDANKFNFFIKDDAVNLHLTIKGEKTIETALAAIARQHGLSCRYHRNDDLSAEDLRLLLYGGNPVLLEDKKTGKWLIAFGMWQNDGSDYVFLNDIDNTTLVDGKLRGTSNEWQSMDLRVITSYLGERKFFDKQKKYPIARDIVSDVDLLIPKLGFEARKYNSGDYQAHIMTDWRESTEAWDSDLRETLKCDAAPKAQAVKPAADATPNLLWNYYFSDAHSNAEQSSACLLPVTAFRPESPSALQNAIVSMLVCQDSTPWKYTLIPNMMWVALKNVQGNALLCPTQEELDALTRLGNERELAFKKRFEAFTGEKYLMISGIDNPDKRLESPHDETRTPEWILSLLDNAENIQQALDSYASNTGKRALLEGGHSAPWQICQRAILQKIPILLHDTKTDGWLIAFGFLEHGGRRLLVSMSPGAIDWKDGEKKRLLGPGMPLPSGVQFEEFDTMPCIPYFIHPFEPDIASVKNQINEIFKNNPEAKKMP